VTHIDAKAGPACDPLPWARRLGALRGVSGVLALFALIFGGIYGGVFTPSEAAGVGAGGALLFALVRRSMSFAEYVEVFVDTAMTTSMMFIVLFGALLFSNFITVGGLPGLLNEAIGALSVDPILVILFICATYLVLGCLLESLSMVLLTIPIFFPIVHALGFDPIWFGVLVVVVVEISMITPPVGMNVFVLKALLPEIPITTIFRGLVPFIMVDVLRLALFITVPSIILFLPSHMK
jgi:tripartite ATP-independent transporter DctM subunit